MARTLKSDKLLFWAAVALVCASVVMVWSASALRIEARGGDVYALLFKQVAYAAAGLGALLVMMRVDYHHLRRQEVVWTLVGVSIVALLAVFAFDPRKGAHRWIEIASFTWQPSELAKIAAIVFTAAVLERRMHRINDPAYALAPIGIVVGAIALLIALEPDLGTPVMMVMTLLAMVVAAGLSWRYVGGSMLLMLPVVAYFIVKEPYRWSRIMAFAYPSASLQTEGYQLAQSKIAIGSGGPFGLGLGNGVQKVHFLPEPDNDFIFAVIGEELGLVGTTAIVLIFGIIVWRGLRASLLAPDRFGALLGIGLVMMVGLQAFVNMSVVVGLAPTKGIPLPFVSAGGTSLLMNLLAMGVLLNISQQTSPVAAASVDER
jgi:cell division protein FtsW